MPSINIGPRVRFALYLVSAIGSAVAAYLFAKGYVGDAELGLWAAVVAIVNTLSAANTNLSGEAVVKVHDAVLEGEVTKERPILGKAFTSTFHRDHDERGNTNVVLLLVVAALAIAILAIAGVRI